MLLNRTLSRPATGVLRHAWSKLALLGLCMAMSGCSNLGLSTDSLTRLVTTHRVDVVQGNFVSSEQVAALKPGMTRNQVRDILGSALLVSIFHADRWDYVFTLQRRGLEPQARQLSVFFKGDLMERFEGDTMPSEIEFVAKLESSRKLGKIPPMQADPDSLKKFAPANPPAARPPPAPAVSENYPPLEGPSR
jgi:outer membrane protein assembly factor BamE